MSNGVRYTPTFAMPSEYEQQAMEARRRRRMAEMLAAQAYQPQDVGVAPIPAAAPLVQGLQAFLTARQLKKAEEAEQKATQADVKGVQDLIEKLNPKEFAGAETAIEEMRQASKPGVLSRDGTYTPSTVMPGTAPVEMPYTEAAPTGKALRDILIQEQTTGTPRARELAKALFNIKPEEAETRETSQGIFRIGKETGTPTPVVYQGQVLMPRDAYSLGMTPQQKAQYDLDVSKFGVDVAQANLARNKAADEGVNVGNVTIPQIGMRGMPSSAPPVAAPQQFNAPRLTPAQMRMGVEPPQMPTRVTPPRTVSPTAAPAVAPTVAPPAAQSPLRTEGGRRPLIETASPKVQRELENDFSRAQTAAQMSIGKLDLLDSYLADLENHKGLDSIAGKLAQYELFDVSPEARSARTVLNSFLEGASIQAISEAREASKTGGAYGSTTEKEWPRLESVFGAVKAAKDPDDLRRAIKNARSQIASARGRFESSWTNTYGNIPIGYMKPEYEPESTAYPRQPAGKKSGWGTATVVSQP